MFLRIAITVVIFAGNALSQAKVGTTGSQFLSIPPSVRSAGMADIGVMLEDGDAYNYNPAVLGLMSKKGRYHLPLAATPDLRGVGIDHYAAGLVRRPSGKSSLGSPSIGYGVDVAYLTSAPMIERTYDRGPDYPDGGLFGTGRTFKWEDVKVGVNVGLGWSGQFDFAIGLALNWIGEYVHDYNANTGAVDLGAYLGTDLAVQGDGSWQPRRLSFGLSYSHLGPDIQFVEKAAPLAKIFRFGAALELSSVTAGRTRFALTPAVEYELCTTDEVAAMKFGLELSYHDLISARAGYRTNEDALGSKQSFGFSLSTLGLRTGEEQAPDSGFFQSLINAVVFDFHYARIVPKVDYLPGMNTFGLSLTF